MGTAPSGAKAPRVASGNGTASPLERRSAVDLPRFPRTRPPLARLREPRRAPAARRGSRDPSRLRHRPLQPPLCLLHAGGGSPAPSPRRDSLPDGAGVGGRVARGEVRRRPGQGHRWRAAREGRPPWVRREDRGDPGCRGSLHDDERNEARGHCGRAGEGGPGAREHLARHGRPGPLPGADPRRARGRGPRRHRRRPRGRPDAAQAELGPSPELLPGRRSRPPRPGRRRRESRSGSSS